MIEKTKSGSRVGIALVGAFATIAGIGEIIVGLTGNYLGILTHSSGPSVTGHYISDMCGRVIQSSPLTRLAIIEGRTRATAASPAIHSGARKFIPEQSENLHLSRSAAN